jgi:ribosome maturation factor RimP
MRATPLENRLTQIIEPVISDMGYDLVLVKIIGEGGSRNVQIMAENRETKNLGIEDCTTISKAVSAVLDVEDPIEGAYRLEVSSPGIDRPLVRLEDFEKFTGFEAKLETSMPIDESRQKRFRGVLKGLEGDHILIDTDQGSAQIPFSALTKAKLVLTDALLKDKPNRQ